MENGEYNIEVLAVKASLSYLFVNSFNSQCTDIINSILEGYPKPKKQLIVSTV